MAGADGIQNHELEPLEVPDKLHRRGNKFVKWPKSDGDDSIVATPVTLKIDPKGYIIYWQEPNKDTESLEISSVRDTRIGKFARIPKSEKWEKVLQCLDPQIREVAGNTSIPLESKCLTVVHGMKFHEPQFLNFIAVEENPLEIIKLWADFLLELACHPLTRHISVERSIEKLHTKMIYETNTFGKIPVRKCIKMLGGNQTRAGNAFNSVGLTTKGKKDEMIEAGEFPLIAFQKVLQLICQRPELDKVFTRLGGKMYLSLEQTKRFINTTQRDSRLNEILHPFLTDDQVKTLIAKYEPNVMLANRSQLSLEGLDAYLQSDENMPVSSTKYSLYQDMSQSLAHYFINSSHNTYLTGTQYRSRSTAEMYRQCLLSGCRCVELDCWDSGGQVEPYITHGFTLCSEVSFKEVIEAIDESAFKTSPYPVILSFENHVDSPSNQAKMAEYCRDIFGDKLLIDPLDQFPLDPEVPLPSPRDMMGKIIVKNKKQKPGDKKNQPEEKGRHSKRPSMQADSSSISPSAVTGISPQNSPFPYNKSGSRTSSCSSTKSAGRKQSAPSPCLSPNLSDGNLKSDVTMNGTFTRCASVGSEMTPKSRRPRSKPRGQSFDDEPIPELSPVGMTPLSSASLPRTIGTPQKNRKQSAPPTTDLTTFVLREEDESSEGADSLSKQSSVETPDIQEGDESEKNENGVAKEDEEEDDDDDDDENEGQLLQDEFDINRKDSGTATKESRAYEAMSSLVNYIQPVRFKSFEHSEKKKRSYEISSLTENGALRLLTYYPIEIVNYNKRQLSRIYPKGARMDSSNYNPQLFWNAGCQLVALNFQTLCASLQLNLSLFEFNDNCGYLLKPEHMRRKDRQFDPFAHNTIDGVVAAALSIKVISGQFLSTSRVSTCVEVDMMGLVADTVKRRFKTNTVPNNGTNPYYNSEPFVFPKVVLPSLATICVSVKETNGNYIGQRYLPVESLRPGYRYITLRNDGNQPLTMPSIFVYIEVKDYIPEKLEMMAAMLANPIEHLKKKEKEEEEISNRRKALHRLLDDEEKRNIPGLQPANGRGEDKPVLIIRDQMPNPDMPPSDQSRIIVIPDVDDPPKDPKSTGGTMERPARPSLEQHLTPFSPAGMEVIQRCKEYADLNKRINKRTAEFIKKQRDEYDTVFSAYFEKQKRSSFFFPRPKDKLRKISLPFDLNPTLPPEAKKEHMLILIKRHLDNELQAQQEINYDFVEELKEVVKREQIKELKQLEKLAEKEEMDVKAKKKGEREENIRNLPKNLSKEQLESKKDDIDKKYIEQTVKEVRFLHELQEKRSDEIKKQQQEIAAQVSDLERMRVKEFARMHKEQTEKAAQIFDIRQAEYYRKRGNSTINSVAYSSDGTNDGDYTTKL